MTLPELLDLARAANPGLRASAAATDGLAGAGHRGLALLAAQGDMLSLLAPSPNVQSLPRTRAAIAATGPASRPTANCIQTNAHEFSLSTV